MVQSQLHTQAELLTLIRYPTLSLSGLTNQEEIIELMLIVDLVLWYLEILELSLAESFYLLIGQDSPIFIVIGWENGLLLQLFDSDILTN